VRFKQVLEAIRRSNGGTVAVPEQDIVEAVATLARMGLYAEPTSAMAAAAAEQLLATGRISPSERTVVLLTGSGLKASAFMTELFSKA
jgi:threonine synthase